MAIGCAALAERPDVTIQGRAGASAQRRAASSHHRPRSIDLDERGALDVADERDAAPRQRALLVGHAVVEIARRPAQHRRRAKHAAPSPLREVGRLLLTADRQRTLRPQHGSGHGPIQTRFDLHAQDDARCRSAPRPGSADLR